MQWSVQVALYRSVEKRGPGLKPPFAQIGEPVPALALSADVKKARAMSGLLELVDRRRIELPTSALRTQRSPS